MCHSFDGINWIGDGSGGLFTSNVNAVAWNGSIWVAGGGNILGYSSNGITWTASSNGSTIFNSNVYAIAWNGYLWVAGGRTTFRLGYSSDGITWTGATTGNTIFATICYGLAWNGSVWVAAGRSASATAFTSTLAYSSDGINWSASTNGNTILSTHGYAVASRRVLPYVGNQQIPLKVKSNEAIAIGGGAGNSLQGTGSVAMGYQAGFTGQGSNSIAIGIQAGQYGLGSNSIAIGNLAGPTGLNYANTIVLNAQGSSVNPGTGSALYIAPIRQDATNITNPVFYNTTTKELTNSTIPSYFNNGYNTALVSPTLTVDAFTLIMQDTTKIVQIKSVTGTIALYWSGTTTYWNTPTAAVYYSSGAGTVSVTTSYTNIDTNASPKAIGSGGDTMTFTLQDTTNSKVYQVIATKTASSGCVFAVTRYV
jgi:hypothetical protein